jgi:hypothetical protein
MASPTRTNVGTVNAAGESLPASSELRPWRGELADSVMSADLNEWRLKQEQKSPEARQAKAIEVEADLRKYQDKLNALPPGDPEFDRFMTKVRKLQLQNDHMESSVGRSEVTRVRISDEEVGEGDQEVVRPAPPRLPAATASAPTRAAKSSLCSVM